MIFCINSSCFCYLERLVWFFLYANLFRSFPRAFFSKFCFAAHFLVFCMKIRLAKFPGKEEILSGKSSWCKEKLAVDFFTKMFYLCKSGRIGQNFPK